MPDAVVQVVKHCARCGEEHHELPVKQFRRPVINDFGFPEWTHWAMCPKTQEPILVGAVEPLKKE